MSGAWTRRPAREVVVTGMGVVSPYGRGCDAYWRGLVEGRCLLGPIGLFPTAGFRSNIGAEIGCSIVNALGNHYRSRANRFIIAAADEAINAAGLDAAMLRGAALSIGGAGGGMLEAEEWYWRHYAQQTTERQLPFLRSMFPASQTATVAQHFHIDGPRESPILACSSSAAALLTLVDLLEAGVADVGIAGGVDTLTRLCFMGFNALKLLDTTPCRPFASDRRGMSLGEGAAVLVLETRHHATARGARIRASIVGGGLTSDAFHPTSPSENAEGAVRAIEEALQRAHLQPADIRYVNAHGTGTVHNDRAEARALERVFGAGKVLVSATKSLLGHAMGAAGALEAVATLLALETSMLPPTAHLDHPDPTIPFDCIPHTARPCAITHAMSNSFGFGGQNVSVIFRRADTIL